MKKLSFIIIIFLNLFNLNFAMHQVTFKNCDDEKSRQVLLKNTLAVTQSRLALMMKELEQSKNMKSFNCELEVKRLLKKIESLDLFGKLAETINRRQDKSLALLEAAHVGDLENLNRLIEAGENIDVSFKKHTPLMKASQFGHSHIVRRLINGGASINLVTSTGATALLEAAKRGCVSIVEDLVQAGAKDCETADGFSALKLAKQGSFFHIKYGLLEAAEKMKHVNDKRGFEVAAEIFSANPMRPKLVRKLIKMSADAGDWNATNIWKTLQELDETNNYEKIVFIISQIN